MTRWLAILALSATSLLSPHSARSQDEFDDISLVPKKPATPLQLTADEVKAIIAEATADGELTGPLAAYALDPSKFDGSLSTQFHGAQPVSEKLKVEALISRNAYAVLKFESSGIKGGKRTDLVGYDKPSDLFRRWRILPDGEILRFTGNGNTGKSKPTLEKFRSQNVTWSATSANGDTLLLSDSASFYGVSRYSWTQATIRENRLHSRENGFAMSEPEELAALQPPRRSKSLFGAIGDIFSGKNKPPEPAPEPEPKEDFVVQEFNYRFKHPGGNYKEMDTKLFNADASLMLTRTRPTAYFAITAEDVGENLQFSTEALVEIAKVNMRGQDPNAIFSEPTDVVINGIKFKRIEITAKATRSQKIKYCNHLAAHNGFLYQLVCWTAERNRMDIAAEAAELVTNFHVIDPNRIALGANVEAVAEYSDPHIGIHAKFDGAEYHAFTGIHELYPAARHAALIGGTGGVMIAALDLRDFDCDDNSITQALMASAGAEYPNAKMKSSPVKHGTASGTEYSLQDRINGTEQTMLIRTLRNADYAIIICAWIAGKGETQLQQLSRAMVCVEFAEPEKTGPTTRASRVPPEIALADANLLNELALREFNLSRFDTAEAIFSTVTDLQPKVPIFLFNLLDSLERQQKTSEALEILEKKKQHFHGNQNLLATRARLLATLGKNDESIAQYTEIFAAGHRVEDDLLVFLRTLISAGKFDDATATIDRFVATEPSPSQSLRRWQTQIYTESGNTKKAAELAGKLYKDFPDDLNVLFEFIDALVSDERPEEALTLIEKLSASGGSGLEWLPYYRGKAHLQLKQYRKAKEAFEAARKHAPQDESIAQGIAMASAGLGQGDNSSIKTPIDPVAIPADLSDALSQIGETPPVPGYNTRVEQSLTGYHFEQGEPRRQTEYRTVRMLNQAGVTESGTLTFTFNPIYERIFVNTLEVLDQDGNKVASGKVSDYYVSGGDASQMATGERILYVPVPGLKTGYTLRYIVTREDLATSDTFRFEQHLFVSFSPAAARAVFVNGDVDHVGAVTSNAEFQTGTTPISTYWLIDSLPLFRFESLQPSLTHYLPILALGQSETNWPQLGKEYLTEIADRLQPDKNIAALAAEITAGLDDQEQKVDAIIRWMQKELTYKAIEFGRRARIPNKNPLTLTNRYGDCKDHSLLLRELLTAAGTDARLALVGDSSLVESLPSLDQFNHMIVYCPDLRGGHFFDCTSKNQYLGLAAPDSLGGLKALVLHPETPTLTDIPAYSIEENSLDLDRTITIADDQSDDLIVSEQFLIRGYYGGWMRDYFRNSNAADHKSNLQRMLGTLAKINIEELSFENLDTLSKPLVLSMRYRIRKAVTDGQKVALPSIWEDYVLRPQNSPERHAPFEIKSPMRLNSKVKFTNPSITALAEPTTREADKPWADWKIGTTANVGEWSQQSSITLQSGVFPKEQFDAYQRALETFTDALKPEITLKK